MSGDSGVTLTDVLRAMSVCTDLGLGQPVEHMVRTSRIALRLGERLGLADLDLQRLYEVSLLTYVGCPVYGDDVSSVFGDDIDFRSRVPEVDLAGFPAMVFMLRRTTSSGPTTVRLRRLGRFMATTGRDVIAQMADHCAAAGVLGERLGLDPVAKTSIQQSYARYDGKGYPPAAGEHIPLPARISHVAEVTEVFARTAGPEAVTDVLRSRAGSHFDPAVVEAVVHDTDALLSRIDEDTEDVEPSPRPALTESELDRVLEAVGDFCDLRCSHFAGHARGTAELAAEAARHLGQPEGTVTLLHRAGLVHDMGRAGVPGSILDKPGPLTSAEWERVRLHPYLVERMFARPDALRRVGVLAAAHHERIDGSGYHRGLSGPLLGLPARILAVADAFHAMTQRRSHRDALDPEGAARTVAAEADAGRFDPAVVEAVLGAAGQRNPMSGRSAGPGGLTARETEVLALISAGMANKQVARHLDISPKTVSNHVEHIYTKIGVSSRAAAALYAMQHGLVGPDPGSSEGGRA